MTGSCPFVYTWASPGDEWRKEGRLLYGANGNGKETVDSLRLDGFDGRLLVREEEQEVTFLRTVYVVATDKDGQRALYYPRNWRSFKKKNGYIELNRGVHKA